MRSMSFQLIQLNKKKSNVQFNSGEKEREWERKRVFGDECDDDSIVCIVYPSSAVFHKK